MNFSKAAKGCFTNSGKQQAISSAAETELGRSLTKQEIAALCTRFSVDELHRNLQKVSCCMNTLTDNFMIEYF